MKIYAVDLFCGVGGLTLGLQQAGINVIAGVDLENACEFPYVENTRARFLNRDIKMLSGKEVDSLYPEDTEVKILVGCAPCQPFSSYSNRYKNTPNKERSMNLLLEFGRIIEEVQPDIVSMENVPQLRKTDVFSKFIDILKKNSYFYSYSNVFVPDYGVPQNRKRLVLLASKYSKISIIKEKYNQSNYLTVRDFIGDLKPLKAGEVDKTDSLHWSAKLSEKNLKRIKQSRPGGSWQDWDDSLKLECHKKKTGYSYTAVYGRMEWDKVAPTITTKFYGYGNGRFGHPEQNRALSLREGALLQTFPRNYKFFDKQHPLSFFKLGVLIGNAVPVKLGKAIGESIFKHIYLSKGD
ncbi:DNA cytosine methyltransferase [uncultured Dubosiella sp.]|uniref:DNA cytosine methyltransferase n=1 Tax=uncultured Dubosiella sp. TaxID=1937011 RepID=UPI00272F1FCA|nr:DNA cytosine methyltransferase [uncultured Dubosiella sp.]